MVIFHCDKKTNMRKIIFLSSFFIFASILVGQNGVQIEERSLNEEMRDAFVLKYDHKGLKEKEVEDQWEKYTKSYGAKSEKDKDTEIHFADNAEINSMSDNTVDVYMKMNTPNDNTRELVVWYDLGGLYLDREGDMGRITAAKDWLYSFLGYLTRLELEEVLDGEEDILKDLEKDFEKAEKAVKKVEKKISKLEKQLEEERENLRDVQSELPEFKLKYEMQEEKVDQLEEKIKSMPEL